MNRLSEICLRFRSALTTFSRNAFHQGTDMRRLAFFGPFSLVSIRCLWYSAWTACRSVAAPSFPGSREVRVYAEEDVTVWVNTKSGIYHYPGSRWYGNTKSGKYMSDQESFGRLLQVVITFPSVASWSQGCEQSALYWVEFEKKLHESNDINCQRFCLVRNGGGC